MSEVLSTMEKGRVEQNEKGVSQIFIFNLDLLTELQHHISIYQLDISTESVSVIWISKLSYIFASCLLFVTTILLYLMFCRWGIWWGLSSMICLCFMMSGSSAGVAHTSGDDWEYGASFFPVVCAKARVTEIAPWLPRLLSALEHLGTADDTLFSLAILG